MADAETDADPRIVFVAENAHLAEAVIQLLVANGLPAELAEAAPQEASALTGVSETPAEEFPIVVTDAAKAKDARELLASALGRSALQAVREKRLARTGTVTAACEDCGKASEWPATAMGTTEVCPHCGGYMDVPDPDEDWSGVDFGTEDDEQAKE